MAEQEQSVQSDGFEHEGENEAQGPSEQIEKVGGGALSASRVGEDKPTESRDDWGSTNSHFDRDGFVNDAPLESRAAYADPRYVDQVEENARNTNSFSETAADPRDRAATYRDVASSSTDPLDKDRVERIATSYEIAALRPEEGARSHYRALERLKAERDRIQGQYERLLALNPEAVGAMSVADFVKLAQKEVELVYLKKEVEDDYDGQDGPLYDDLHELKRRLEERSPIQLGGHMVSDLLRDAKFDLGLQAEVVKRYREIAAQSFDMSPKAVLEKLLDIFTSIENALQVEVPKRKQDLQDFRDSVKSGDFYDRINNQQANDGQATEAAA